MEQARINLLFVDDETDFLVPMTRRLEQRGFRVTAVDRGEKAVEMARKVPVDVALVDLKMPGISGKETLEALKRDHRWMEVIILTGHGSIPSAVRCTQAGSCNYLQKPCETEELLEVLKNAYQKRVQRKLQIDQEKVEKLLGISMGESPLGILRRLREIEQGQA